MRKKFAKINFIKDKKDIPIAFNLILNNSDLLMDWYIKKFNPFIMEELSIAGEFGYNVYLPMTLQETSDVEKTEIIFQKTVEELLTNNVEIIQLPKNYLPPELGRRIRVATGGKLLPFFLFKAINRAIKFMSKDIKTCEFLIIDEGDIFTEIAMDVIYPHINFLTIISDSPTDYLLDKSEYIFSDIGLDIGFSKGNKKVVQSADIIINCSFNPPNYDYTFKKNSVFIDLSHNTERLRRLINCRNDMLIVDDFRVRYKGESMNLSTFELIFYTKIKEYRMFLTRSYNPETVEYLIDFVERLQASVVGFYQLSKSVL